MALQRAGRGLDWLQRGHAAWATVPESAKQWIRGLVGAGMVSAGSAVAARMSNWTPVDAYMLAVALGAVALVSYGVFLKLRGAVATPTPSNSVTYLPRTLIRLAFNATPQPTLIESENIFRWYCLRMEILVHEPNRAAPARTFMAWVVCLTFDRQLDSSAAVFEIDGNHAWELKDLSPRSAVIVFSEDVRGNVTLRVRYPAAAPTP